ncbi:MAG: RIP metalloprotease RseP [Bacteroidales bacterium]|nr:RIP metalloprotease RseP [Bacteroidales bacterium]
MIALVKTLQVFLALSILIIVHEFGHFLFSKLSGTRVDKFYLFFDAGGFRLFSTRHNPLIRKYLPRLAQSETDYGIGWLPLGGYCKIAGMVDESMDTDQLKHEPQPWEFRSKKSWQRLLIMAGGVLFNFILAIVLYIGILAHWGKSYVANEGNCLYVNELAYDMGFRDGDHIISFDDYVPENFYMLQADMVRSGASTAIVQRGKDTVTIYLDQSRVAEILQAPGMFDLALPFVVDTIVESSPNFGGALLRDDQIVAVSGIQTPFLQDARKVFEQHPGDSVAVSIVRSGDTLVTSVQVDTAGKIGVYTRFPGLKTKEYSVLEAIPAGFVLAYDTVVGYVKDMKLVFTPSTGAYKSVGSFISIGQAFPSAWDWYQFINILALLSIMLGVMNLLPIPALDGGHIVLTLYEMVTGRAPSEKFLVVTQILGMILIFMLMILAFGNDIGRLIR